MGIENFKDTKIYQVSETRAQILRSGQDIIWNANKEFNHEDNLAHRHKVWHKGVWYENGVPHPHMKQPK